MSDKYTNIPLIIDFFFDIFMFSEFIFYDVNLLYRIERIHDIRDVENNIICLLGSISLN